MTIYTIDGNIGSGKSSVLNYLHKYKNIQIDLEPIEKWKPFLDNIYLSKTVTTLSCMACNKIDMKR